MAFSHQPEFGYKRSGHRMTVFCKFVEKEEAQTNISYEYFISP